MPDIRDFVARRIMPYSKMLLTVFLLVMFILVAVYAYNKYGKKILKTRQFTDVANEPETPNEIEIAMYTVDWCPHCKNAKPEWGLFTGDTEFKEPSGYLPDRVNGYNVKYLTVDCTNDSEPTISERMQKYGVDSFPTVIMVKDGKKYDFDAKVTKSNLDQFVGAVTSAE